MISLNNNTAQYYKKENICFGSFNPIKKLEATTEQIVDKLVLGQNDTEKYKRIAADFLDCPECNEITGLKRFLIRSCLVKPLSETPLGKTMDISKDIFYGTSAESAELITQQGFKLGVSKAPSALVASQMGQAVYLTPDILRVQKFGEKVLATKVITDNTKVGFVSDHIKLVSAVQTHKQLKLLNYLRKKVGFVDLALAINPINELRLPKLFESLGYDAVYMPNMLTYGNFPQLAVFDPKKVQVVK